MSFAFKKPIGLSSFIMESIKKVKLKIDISKMKEKGSNFQGKKNFENPPITKRVS